MPPPGRRPVPKTIFALNPAQRAVVELAQSENPD
jgi:hypothetical protein